MRTRIKRGIEFLAFLAILALLFSSLTWLMRGNEVFSRPNIVEFRNMDQLDVVLYGASTTFFFFQPVEAWNQAGFTSYNYGTSGAPFELMVPFLRESRTVNEAQLYVCDLKMLAAADAENNKDVNVRHWFDSLSIFSPERTRSIATFLSNHRDMDLDAVSYFFDIAKYHTNYDAFSDGDQWMYLNLRKVHRDSLSFETYPDKHVIFNPPPQVTDVRAELSPFQQKMLNELLDYCDEESLPVLFTVCPYIISAEDWAIFNTCGDIIRERGYDFVNFNACYDEIGLDFETDFLDVNHVNYLGSQKYTAFLVDYLTQRYDLPDHRGDAAYSAWEEYSADYTKVKEKYLAETTETVNSNLASAEIAERLPGIDDPATWLSLVQDDHFTVLVERDECEPVQISDPLAAGLYKQMLALWELDGGEPRRACAWTGKECLSEESEADLFAGEIGTNYGLGTASCTVRAGDAPQIMVDGTDYYSGLGGIQVVVFDDIRHEIVDSVNILADESGLKLIR